MKFSIIVVCLNPGGKLNQTLDSVLAQTYGDYEIIVKDGGSGDGSVENMRKDARIRFFAAADRGIYDAMNQAVAHIEGEYVLFLNCGDVLYDERVLERTAECIERKAAAGAGLGGNSSEKDMRPAVFYGDTFGSKNGVLIAAPPSIDGFACYRNIPCHQSCFYAAGLCRLKAYEQRYRIRADYDHFLWCFYEAKAKMEYLGFTVSSYEGGGYSESRENRQRNKREHREITEKYMSRAELMKYRGIMLLTLAPLRSFLAESRVFSGFYHRMKKRFYSG